MNAYCPECETELDVTTGICPACRWDPLVARTMNARPQEPQREMSLTERYRGTQFDVSMQQAIDERAHVSRGRAFVLMALVAAVGLYGGAMSAMGLF
jgi:predicted ATP-dependent serine protease